MRRFIALCAVFLSLASLFMPSALADTDLSLFDLQAEICVYDTETHSFLRACGSSADLKALGEGEFYTYVLYLTYKGNAPIEIKKMSVSVDGSDRWGWSAHTLQPGSVCAYPIYYSNMKSRQTEGAHSVTWYLGNQIIHQDTFTFVLGMDWQKAFSIPDDAQIAEHNRTSSMRSPYLYAYLKISDSLRFTEYAIDFKADSLPKATYLCLANMRMDLSALEKKYQSVRTEYDSVHMYAGFQRRWNETNAIMSFWDIYCTDKSGNQETIRARLLYPASVLDDSSFSGEGSGARALVPYAWQSGRWYRMLLQCSQSPDTDTTLVEQWVLDLETGVWTLLSRYDTGVPDSCFMGPVAFFLENFDPAFSGDVRTMEVCNIRLRRADTGNWQAVSSVMIGSNGGHPTYDGSYAFGALKNRFYMITSGVGGDWYGQNRVRQNQTFKVTDSAADSPY